MAKTSKSIDNTDICSLTQTAAILTVQFANPESRRLVPMLYGGPGIGKSSIVRQAAKAAGINNVITFNAAQRAREDLTGLPFLTQPEDPDKVLGGEEPLGWSSFKPPKSMLMLTKRFHEQQRKMHEAEVQKYRDEAARLEAAGEADKAKQARKRADNMGEYKDLEPTILFLDEFPNAPPDVQTTYHSLLLDRTFGDEEYELHDNVMIVIAGNRRRDGARTYDMSLPIRTRISPHIVVQPTHEEFLEYARKMNFYPPLIAFIRQHESTLNLGAEDADNKDVMTTATPRTWEMTSVQCKAWDNTSVRAGVEDRFGLLAKTITGTIGPKAAANFIQYLRTARQAPTPDQIAADPDKIDTFDDKPDIAFTVVETMVSAVKRDPKKYMGPFMRYSKRMNKTYRAIFEPTLVNLSGGMSEEVILMAIESPEAGGLMETAEQFDRAQQAGDEEAKDSRAKLAKKRQAAQKYGKP